MSFCLRAFYPQRRETNGSRRWRVRTGGRLLDSGVVGPSADEHAQNLLDAGVAGVNTSHGAQDNMLKIRRLLEGHPAQTFGMDPLLGGATFDEAYGAVEGFTGYPPDGEQNPDRGRIDPARTAAGLLEAGARVRAVAGAGGTVVLGTGHPGALLVYYLELARWVQELGGQTPSTAPRTDRKSDEPLDWAGDVAVLGDGASLMHTHSPEPMRHILARLGPVDLVVADHGFAGAAISAGVPAVAVMDTNDPALAVVAGRGADLTVVPMDDNRPLNSYAAALAVIKAGP